MLTSFGYGYCIYFFMIVLLSVLKYLKLRCSGVLLDN